MDYNILIGGAAGQGMESLSAILEKVLKRKGLYVFTIRDYMSRVRGGHNFIKIRFGNEKLTSHRENIDGIIALNEETISIHKDNLDTKGFIICDEGEKAGEFSLQNFFSLPLKSISKDIGNTKVFGSVALGAMLKLFNLDTSQCKEVLEELFKPEAALANLKAIEKGQELIHGIYNLKPGQEDKNILINGNDSIALGALAAGCKFYAAYPMTPSTSIMNYLASKVGKANIVVEQAEDEISAINMAIGASYAGVRSMTGTSGGGFALMVEAVGLSGMQEVPLVIANIQRPGPTTGLPTRTEQGDLKFVISSSPGEIPKMVIALRNPEDCFYQTIRAFNIADKYRIPVIILGDQYLADYTTTIPPFDTSNIEINRYLNDKDYYNGKEFKSYEVTQSGISPRIIPGKIKGTRVLADSDEHDEYGMITESAEVRIKMNDKRLKKMELLKDELQEPFYYGDNTPDVLLIAWGSLDGPVREAMSMLSKEANKKYGAMVFGDVWPLPTKLLLEKSKDAKSIINIEQNATGQLASLIMEVTGIRCTNSIKKYDGRPISAQEIYNRVKEAE